MYLNNDLFLEVSTVMHTTHAHNTNHMCMHLITSHFLMRGLSCYQLITQQFPYVANVQCLLKLFLSGGFTASTTSDYLGLDLLLIISFTQVLCVDLLSLNLDLATVHH